MGNNRNCWYTVIMAKCHTFWSDRTAMKRHHSIDPIEEQASDLKVYIYTSTSIEWRIKMSLALCYLHNDTLPSALPIEAYGFGYGYGYGYGYGMISIQRLKIAWRIWIYNFWFHLGTYWEIVLSSYYLYYGLWAVLLRSLPYKEIRLAVEE